ncbi:MAG TPA: preprotein translocase subunit YajC [Opitutaceae bacterium]|nr:preprotein translocase subunit YajC [Opitutaceae bacterium]
MTKMSLFLAQQVAAGAPAGASGLLSLLPMALIMLAMYFILIAPQRKQKKEQDRMIAAIASGDEVVTSSGIFGTITNIKDDRFVLRIADNTKIEIGKAFITAVVKKSE